MFDVITIGDCVSDLFIKPHEVDSFRNKFNGTEICFPHGSKISVDEFHRSVGGSACNVAVGLSRLGYKSAIIGALGADSEAEKIRNKLAEENVDTANLKNYAGASTNFSVIIVYKNDRTVLIHRGLKDYSKIKIPKNIKTKWLYLGPVANSFEPNYKEIIRLASEKNVNLAINPGYRQITEGREALKRLIYVSKVLIVNKEEAIDLAKTGNFSNIKELLKRLKSFGAEVVVITDGENGAYLAFEDSFYGVKKHETEVVDATGAGDAFSTGFLASIFGDNSPVESLKWGIMCASEVINSYGAETKLPNLEKLKKLVKMTPDVYTL